MSTRHSSLWVAVATGLIVGAIYPFVELGVKCRRPVAAACAWSKAFLPLTLGASVLLLGGMVTGLLYTLLVWRSRS